MEQVDKLYQEIVDEFVDFLPVHLSLIQKLESSDVKSAVQWPFTFKSSTHKLLNLETVKSNLKRIQELANLVINGTDGEALLAFYGLKSDSRPDAVKIKG